MFQLEEAVMRLFAGRCARAIVFLILLQATACLAQFSGGVQGSLLDSSGAAVPNATLTLENVDTHVTQTAHSDAGGVYRFVSLAPGNYTVTAAANGFAQAKTAFVLDAAENRDVSFRLEVGSVDQRVVVTAEAPLIDPSETRNQYTIDQQALETLPQSNRNPEALLGITPGVTGGLDVQGALPYAPENELDFGVNGRGENGNQYIVDGLDVTSNIRPGTANLSPQGDAIAEVTVQADTYNVEYGRGSGFQTIATSKSGTDQFHGIVSEYYRYQKWAARGEFGPNYQLLPVAPPYHTNNLSFDLGGPIWKSHKLFFFASYQPYHTEGSDYVLEYYEDPAFVTWAAANFPASPELSLLQKYPETKTIFKQVFQNGQQYFGATSTGGCQTAYYNYSCTAPVVDQGEWNSASATNGKQYNVRIDKYFNKDRVYANFIRNTLVDDVPNPRGAFNETYNYYGAALQINETHTFSPTMLNEAAFGFNRIEGIQPQTGLFTVPVVNVYGVQPFGDGFALGDYIQHSYHWRDVLTKIHGNHSFKFGYEGWTGDDAALFQGPYGQPNFYFNNLVTMLNNTVGDEYNLSYNPISGKSQPGNYDYKELTGGLFAQDSWKFSKKLTLTYGIRYDNFGNPVPNGYGTVAAPFRLGSGSSFQDQLANGYVKQQSHSLDHDMNWNFAPRGGVAWDIFGNAKWVLRGGYGLYHDQITLGNIADLMKGNPPNWVLNCFGPDCGGPPAGAFGYGTSNSYPFGFTYPTYPAGTLDSKGGKVGSNIFIGSVPVDAHSPLTQTWSTALEHAFTSRIVGSVGYTGSHSSGEQMGVGQQGGNQFGYDLNYTEGVTLQNSYQFCCGPFQTISRVPLNTSFGNIDYAYAVGRANYSALVTSVRGRFKQAFFVASYTRSVEKDDELYYAPTPSLDQNRWYGNTAYDYPNRFSFGYNYQIPGFHHGNFLVKGATNGWAISGTTILQSGAPMLIVNESQLAYNVVNGSPVFEPYTGDYEGDGYNYAVPNVNTSYKMKKTRAAYTGHALGGLGISGVFPNCNDFADFPSTYTQGNLYNCGPFTAPAPFSEGNEKVDSQFRNPGFAETDLTLAKNTRFREGIDLNLKVDAYNLFNQVNFYGLDTNGPDNAFGTTSSTHVARYLQVGGTIRF
jgi:hypothetical protein